MHSVLLKRCSQHQLSDTAARVRGTLSSLSVVVALVPIALGHFALTTPPYSWPSALTVHLSTHWHFSDTRIRNGCLSLGRTETEPAFRSDFGRRAHTSHTRASDFGSSANWDRAQVVMPWTRGVGFKTTLTDILEEKHDLRSVFYS